MAKFKPEILELMRTDPRLHATVATAMGVMPTSLGPIISRNGNSLNQHEVVIAVAKYLKKDPSELRETETAGA